MLREARFCAMIGRTDLLRELSVEELRMTGWSKKFDLLHARRETWRAFTLRQRNAGWVCPSGEFNRSGISGRTLQRPSSERLLERIRAGQIDQVVLHKFDCLTRSWVDYSKIMDIL